MVEYIEREAARQAHIKASLTTRLIDAIPAADVAPVRHGKWNDINPTVLNHGVNWVCRCSLCGCPQDYKQNYCPNCGAKMERESNEDNC